MSQQKNRWQAERWLTTAHEDLQAARVLAAEGLFAAACFHSEQCGEKAVKAIWYLGDFDPWGHSILKLLQDFPYRDEFSDLERWMSDAGLLDQFYVPTRYPNGLPDLTPGQIFSNEDAQRALRAAENLLHRCRDWFEQRG